MTPPFENGPDPHSFDPFAAARNHPAILSPDLTIPVSNPSAPLPDPFAAVRNYAGVVPSTSRAASPLPPYIDPFAAARNFPSSQATASGTLLPAEVALQNYLRAQAHVGTSSHPLHTTSKSERQVDRPGEEAPPAKKAKVNNTIVRMPIT